MPDVIAEPATDEHIRAKHWRQNVLKMNVDQLAAIIGYSREAIYLFERGITNQGKPHTVDAWRRYKLACATVMNVRGFDWQ